MKNNIKNKTCRKSNKKSKKIQKKSRTRRTRGGSCPCSKPFLFQKMNGGAHGEPSFSSVPIRSFYPQNNYKDDVQGGQISSRLGVQTPTTPNIMNGGRKRRRKMKGGVIGGPFSEQLIRTASGPTLPSIVTTYDGLSGSLLARNIVGSRLI